MRLAVFGRTGQVATELARALPGARFITRAEADFADPDAVARAARGLDADVVINAAAHTAVDRAEGEEALATTVNGDSPGALAAVLAGRGVPLLHISTDYVFDGAPGRAWREDDPVAPLGAYGRSKLAGERQVAAAGPDHVILRTAWVFSAHGGNFVKTMLRVGAERAVLRVVADQRGGPTPARDIAAALVTIARAMVAGRGVGGVFHFAGAPPVTWADFAEAILAASRLERKPQVERITTADYPTPARRPANSVLDCTRIADVYGIAQPDWRAGLAEVLKELP
jgi:dTDP-4-dehydrorhamnose reductase